MKIGINMLKMIVLLSAVIWISCSNDTPVSAASGPHEIQPMLKIASTLSISEIDHAKALVSGSGIDGELEFELLVDQSGDKLYGTLKIPDGVSTCEVVIRMYDASNRKIGEGACTLAESHFSAGRYVTAEVGIESAKPRIDTLYSSPAIVGINDTLQLFSTASDSFSGSIVEYAWKCGAGAWFVDGDGDTTVTAPSTAQSWVCSLKVTDDDGNVSYASQAVTVETRAPDAVAQAPATTGINDAVTLTGSGSSDETSIVEYAWKCGDGAWLTDADGDTTVTAPSTGQFWVCSLRVTDDDGNSSYAAQVVVVGTPTVTDADGNVYTTVIIGNQIWTVENLRTTKYNDGTAIPHVTDGTDGTQWSNLSTPGYCWYANSTVTMELEKWGALYNWYTVNTGKLAPSGWRVPTDADWTALEEYLIANGYNWDGSTSGNKIGKSLATKTEWSSSSTAGDVGNDLSSNNSTGFSALPGGYRTGDGDFDGQSDNGGWWSSTESGAASAYNRTLIYVYEDLFRGNGSKEYGFSVRLVRDLN